MMVAGRILPVLGVGYIAYGFLPDRDSSQRDSIPGKLAGQTKDNIDVYVDVATDVYTGVTIGYNVGSYLLQAALS